MKVLCLLAICILYFNTRSGYADEIPSIDVVLREKCTSNNENATAIFLNMDNALFNLTYISTYLISRGAFYGFDMQLCKPINQAWFYTSLNKFVDNLALCLTQEELYLPNFLLGSFNNTMEEFCKSDGWTRVMGFFEKIFKSPCGQLGVLNLCAPTLNVYNNIAKHHYIWTQNELCGDLEMFQYCSTNIFSQCEPYYPTMIKFMMAPILDWCNKN